jgi:N-acetylmuramoyl-L-alanine amidase
MVGLTAGHHAYDSGAVGITTGWPREHLLTLQTLGHAMSFLASSGIYVVSPTGKLSRKIAELNRHKVEVAVEIHYNSVASPNLSGLEAVYHPGSTRGKALAEHLAHKLASLEFLHLHRIVDTNRLGRRLAFTREVAAPAVIIEPLWISNPQERKVVEDPANVRIIGAAIGAGILEFINQ